MRKITDIIKTDRHRTLSVFLLFVPQTHVKGVEDYSSTPFFTTIFLPSSLP